MKQLLEGQLQTGLSINFMSWYEDWFNSDEYLKVYKHRDEAEAETLVNLIRKHTGIREGDDILDLACGAGRHSVAFALNGFNVTSVDFSKRLMLEAKRNAAHSGVTINFILSDFRDLVLQTRFSLVVNLFTSFGYLETDEENFSIIKKANDFLLPGGYFVLDYFNKKYLEKNLVPVSVAQDNGTTITQKRSLENNRVVKKISIQKGENLSQFSESVRLFSFNELISILESNKFTIENILGDFNGSIFNENESPRTIIFARK